MKINVSHIAKLANLPITSNEEKKFEKQLDETLEYVKILDEIDTKDTQSTSQVTGLENVADEDIAEPSLSQEQALANAKSTHNGLFKVNAILENE